jgi:hypothetical protein
MLRLEVPIQKGDKLIPQRPTSHEPSVEPPSPSDVGTVQFSWWENPSQPPKHLGVVWMHPDSH